MATRDRVAELDQVARAEFEREGAPAPLPVIVPRTGKKFFFRTDPGYRQCTIRIPGAVHDPRYSEERNAFFKRQYEKTYDANQRAHHEAVREANGGDWYITFRHVPNRFEAFFETDSEVLAQFIRDQKKPYIYEDASRPQDVRNEIPSHRARAALRVQEAQAKAANAAD